MKVITVSILLLSSTLMQAQDLYLNAGSTISGVRHSSSEFTKKIGYFVGVSGRGDLSKTFSYSGSLQFVNQHMAVLDADLNVNAVNATFYYGVHPVEKFTILGGIQMGYIVSVKVDDAEVPDFKKEQLGWVAGVAYDVLDKMEVQCRYINAINEQVFDYTIQVGVSYRL